MKSQSNTLAQAIYIRVALQKNFYQATLFIITINQLINQVIPSYWS